MGGNSHAGSWHLSFGSWCAWDFVCVLYDWSLCFPQSCGSPIIKFHWLWGQILWRVLVPLSDLRAWKPDMGFRTFTTVGELLWFYCSPACGSPTQWVWDLISLWLCPFHCLVVSSSLSLDVGYLFFFVCSSILLSIVVQQLVAILVFLQGEMSACPSILPSWTACFYILKTSFQNSELLLLWG